MLCLCLRDVLLAAPKIDGFPSSRFAGDIIHFDPHQLVRVLPARGRDHPADLPGRPPPREVPHIRHDTGLNKVRSELHFEEAEVNIFLILSGAELSEFGPPAVQMQFSNLRENYGNCRKVLRETPSELMANSIS